MKKFVLILMLVSSASFAEWFKSGESYEVSILDAERDSLVNILYLTISDEDENICYLYDLNMGYHLDRAKVKCHKNNGKIILGDLITIDNCPNAQQQRQLYFPEDLDMYTVILDLPTVKSKTAVTIHEDPEFKTIVSTELGEGLEIYSCN